MSMPVPSHNTNTDSSDSDDTSSSVQSSSSLSSSLSSSSSSSSSEDDVVARSRRTDLDATWRKASSLASGAVVYASVDCCVTHPPSSLSVGTVHLWLLGLTPERAALVRRVGFTTYQKTSFPSNDRRKGVNERDVALDLKHALNAPSVTHIQLLHALLQPVEVDWLRYFGAAEADGISVAESLAKTTVPAPLAKKFGMRISESSASNGGENGGGGNSGGGNNSGAGPRPLNLHSSDAKGERAGRKGGSAATAAARNQVGASRAEARLFRRLEQMSLPSASALTALQHSSGAYAGVSDMDLLEEALFRDTVDCFRTLASLEPYLVRPMGGRALRACVDYIDPRLFRSLVRLYYQPMPRILREVAGQSRQMKGFFKSRSNVGGADAAGQLALPQAVVRRQVMCIREIHRFYLDCYSAHKRMLKARGAHGDMDESFSVQDDEDLGLSSDDSSASSSTSEMVEAGHQNRTNERRAEASREIPFLSLTSSLERQYLMTPAVANRWTCYVFYMHHRLQIRGHNKHASIKATRFGIKHTLHSRLGDLEYLASVMITSWCARTGSLKLDKAFVRIMHDMDTIVHKSGRRIEEKFRPHILSKFEELWESRVSTSKLLREGTLKQEKRWKRWMRQQRSDADVTAAGTISRFKSNCLPGLMSRIIKLGARLFRDKDFSDILSVCDEKLLQFLMSAFSSRILGLSLSSSPPPVAEPEASDRLVLVAQIETVFEALIMAFRDDRGFFERLAKLLPDTTRHKPLSPMFVQNSFYRLLSPVRAMVLHMLKRLQQHEEAADAKRISDLTTWLPEVNGHPDYVFAYDVNERWGIGGSGSDAGDPQPVRVERQANETLMDLP